MKILVCLFLFQLLSFDTYSQKSDNETCTVTTAILLPVKLGFSMVSCATIVEANPLSVIGCKSVYEILSDPIEWWEGNVNNCKVVVSKIREGEKVKTTMTVTGKKEDVNRITDAFKKSAKIK